MSKWYAVTYLHVTLLRPGAVGKALERVVLALVLPMRVARICVAG